jgi:hypothetical protein
MRFLTAILIITLNCSCTYKTTQHITNKAIAIAFESGLMPKIYKTKNFSIFTLKKITDPKKNLRVYIESDGKAFVTKRSPSLNPTPTSYFLINLIGEDDSSNILYVARPCQYQVSNQGFCSTNKYWTTNRFAPEVIQNMNEILANFSDYKIEIIGYSGGGQIAKHLTLLNKNIINLRTIAGNIDQEEFAKIHNVPQLNDDWSEADLSRISKVAQIHFVGDDDEVVPIIIAQKYLQKLTNKNCSKITQVKKVSHLEGWKVRWKELLEEKFKCESYRL